MGIFHFFHDKVFNFTNFENRYQSENTLQLQIIIFYM